MDEVVFAAQEGGSEYRVRYDDAEGLTAKLEFANSTEASAAALSLRDFLEVADELGRVWVPQDEWRRAVLNALPPTDYRSRAMEEFHKELASVAQEPGG